MELTNFANWLNSFFAGYDHLILEMLHKFAVSTGGHLTWLFKLISLFAEKGLFLLLLAV